jgi:geranylgeranyl pyrophosphate synthase
VELVDTSLHLTPLDHSLIAEVDRRIHLRVSDVEHPDLRGIIRGATEGGKRIRPLMTCLACEAAGGKAADAMDAGVAVDLLHVSSLIHDDIMDQSLLRRGKPTVYAVHGIALAILAGDALTALAYKSMELLISERKLAMLSLLTRTFLDLCEGQASDVRFDGRSPADVSGHRKMVEQKTARLLEASAAIGGMVATGDDRIVRALAGFGLHVGMAYQAQDDLLDCAGDEAETGKSLGVDVQNGRGTYLTLAYPAADPAVQISGVVRAHTADALASLAQLPPSGARETLRELALSLVTRRK